MKMFYIKQKVFSLTDQYRIFNEHQELEYYVKGQFFSVSRKKDFYRAKDDKHLFHFQRRLFSFMPTYYMTDDAGLDVATIRKQWAAFRNNLNVESSLGMFDVKGSFWAHSFEVLENGRPIASIKKRVISWGDTYEIMIDDESKEEFLLALVILIDSIFHNQKKGSSGNR